MEINKLIEGVYLLKNGTILELIDIGVYGGVIQIYSNEHNYIYDIRCTEKDFLNLSVDNIDSVYEKFTSFILDNEDKYNICEEELEELNFYSNEHYHYKQNGGIVSRSKEFYDFLNTVETKISFLPKYIYEDTNIRSYNITPVYYRNINIEIHDIINIINFNGGITKDLTTDAWESEHLSSDKFEKRIASKEQQILEILIPVTGNKKMRRI
ncbi:hypothetical protein IAH96_003676 [Escherichia coli]|nr:hypothetical protein [Salmonella enterica subsp. enterica serovar Muenchen]EGD1872943.1 hypothetical protein [Escherichia coli]